MAANTTQDIEIDEGRDEQLPCAACDQKIIWVGRAVARGGYSHMDPERNTDHRPVRDTDQ
jgi:hypothetical protein